MSSENYAIYKVTQRINVSDVYSCRKKLEVGNLITHL